MRKLARMWRRSLQLRVVTGTFALSGLFMGATGWALGKDIADSQVRLRHESATSDVRLAAAAVQAKVSALPIRTTQISDNALSSVVNDVRGLSPKERTYELVVERPGERVVAASSKAALRSIPAALRHRVEAKEGVKTADTTVDGFQAVAVGTKIAPTPVGETFSLYYIYPMRAEAQTLALIRGALWSAGVASVFMVSGISYLVSREVLVPVRLARRTSERYASGELDLRMPVHGEDDLARLSTSFNQMAASLQNQITQLQQLSVLQRRFVSDVSHELRNPLTTLHMAGNRLFEERGSFDPVSARSAELLKTELDRFEGLLLNLLDLSRIDAGAVHLEFESIDLSQVAKDAAEDRLLDGTAVSVLGGETPQVVQADRQRVDRILSNLLANAARYSKSDRIELEIRPGAGDVSLVVRDFGVGLTGEELEHCFDRFWRADPARSEGGTGLGLAISSENARVQGGTLTAHSEPGRVTEFVLTLQRDPQDLDG